MHTGTDDENCTTQQRREEFLGISVIAVGKAKQNKKQRQKSESAIVKVIVEKALIINPSSVVCACVIRCCSLRVSRRLPSVLHQTKHILFLSYLLDFVLCPLLRLVHWRYRLDNHRPPKSQGTGTAHSPRTPGESHHKDGGIQAANRLQ